MQAPALPELPLFVWLSPAFPVGAFAYSHGVEWAVEARDIHDADTLRGWIADLLNHGSARNDAVLTAAAWRAASAQDMTALAAINALALALSPSRERHLETTGQGNAFVLAMRDSWPCPLLAQLAAQQPDLAYPVALGIAAAEHSLALASTLEACLLAFVSNLASATVRLGPIGQTDCQRVLAALLPDIRACAAFATASTLDDLGGAALRSDIASMKHETQYSRLFRS